MVEQLIYWYLLLKINKKLIYNDKKSSIAISIERGAAAAQRHPTHICLNAAPQWWQNHTELTKKKEKDDE